MNYEEQQRILWNNMVKRAEERRSSNAPPSPMGSITPQYLNNEEAEYLLLEVALFIYEKLNK